jgi:hypothetical protein
LWDDGVIPPGLKGMHLISSAPDSQTDSYGGTFTKWVVEAVQKAKNWAQFVAILKYRHRHSTAKKSRPRAGDVVGCFATVKLIDVSFAGEDVGFMKDYATSIYGHLVKGTDHLFRGHSVKPGKIIYEGFFGPCGPGKSVVIDVGTTVANPDGGTMLPDHTTTIPFDCDNQPHYGDVVVSVKWEKTPTETLSATITFKVEIRSGCK